MGACWVDHGHGYLLMVERRANANILRVQLGGLGETPPGPDTFRVVENWLEPFGAEVDWMFYWPRAGPGRSILRFTADRCVRASESHEPSSLSGDSFGNSRDPGRGGLKISRGDRGLLQSGSNAGSLSDISWILGCMDRPKDGNLACQNRVEDEERKSFEKRLAHRKAHFRIHQGMLRDVPERSIEQIQELFAQSGHHSFVLLMHGSNITLSRWGNVEYGGHSPRRIRPRTSGQGEAASGFWRCAARREWINSRVSGVTSTRSGTSAILSQISWTSWMRSSMDMSSGRRPPAGGPCNDPQPIAAVWAERYDAAFSLRLRCLPASGAAKR